MYYVMYEGDGERFISSVKANLATCAKFVRQAKEIDEKAGLRFTYTILKIVNTFAIPAGEQELNFN
jgi:hypothetical protein